MGQSFHSPFRTTRWSVVLQVGDGDPQSARQALETLCQTYWFPLYAFARRKGHDAERAQDLVQGFFAKILEKKSLEVATPEKGRFRSFLRQAFANFAINQHHKESAIKRAGIDGITTFSFDQDPEQRFQSILAHEESPDKIYLRTWALTLLTDVLDELKKDYQAKGKEAIFEALKDCITGASDVQDRAQKLGFTEGHLRVTLHRLRGHYRQKLRSHIEQTLEEGMSVEEELRELFSAFQKK